MEECCQVDKRKASDAGLYQSGLAETQSQGDEKQLSKEEKQQEGADEKEDLTSEMLSVKNVRNFR